MSDPREALEDALAQILTHACDSDPDCSLYGACDKVSQHVERLERERDEWKDSHDVARRKASDARIERDARYTSEEVKWGLRHAHDKGSQAVIEGAPYHLWATDDEAAEHILRWMDERRAQHKEKNNG